MGDVTGNSPKKIGTSMLIIAWVIVFALLTLALQGWLDNEENPNQSPTSRTMTSGVREVELERNRYNAYVSSGSINRQPVLFIVDTGATDVVIPAALAKKIGLRKGLAGTAMTANGNVTTYATQLDSLSIGNIQLRNVRAVINPGMSGKEVLLGMSALKHIEFSQRGNTMTLRQYPSQ